ncbi:MAG: hypothetical protein FJY97_06345 [candidate division Zixibacteria bacterium]|nr:hypothetical protein [candidate division Zixibacteria bacterium]
MITFQIPDMIQPNAVSRQLRLTLCDTQAMAVRTLAGGRNRSGLYTVQWDGCVRFGTPVASGVYILKLEAPPFSQSRKIIVL